MSIGAAVAASVLEPAGRGDGTTYVASEYQASLTAAFALVRRRATPGKKPMIWTAPFSRLKRFPANNRLDVLGTTSALINESEFDRALGDLAESMMGDVHESMLSMF
mgnify:CR=1 FL=1